MANEVSVGGRINWEQMFFGRMNAGMQWPSALSELLDNSLDAQASAIEITFKPRSFEISDNGNGSPSLEPFFGMGVHQAHVKKGRDPLGVWGIGGKHAVLYISRDLKASVRIESRTKAVALQIDTTWARLATKFNAGETVSADAGANDSKATGCRIQLRGPVREAPHGADLAHLLRTLSFRYSKALNDGVKIIVTRGGKVVRSDVLQPHAVPDLSDTVTDTFEVNGKRVRLMVGVVPQGVNNERPGLHYRYSYRVIKESSANGCGDYSTLRVFGFIDLLDGWKLDLHKDGVTDKDAKILYAEVFARIERILKLAQGQLMLAESAALLAEVDRRLNEAINKTKKGKRGKGTKRGTKEPTGRGKPHADAETKQPGSTMPGDEQPRRSVHVGFAELDTDVAGDFKGNTVRLNTRIEAVARYRNENNADAVFAAAMFVYWMHRRTAGMLTEMEVRDMLLNVGTSLRADAAPRLDGKKLDSTEAA